MRLHMLLHMRLHMRLRIRLGGCASPHDYPFEQVDGLHSGSGGLGTNLLPSINRVAALPPMRLSMRCRRWRVRPSGTCTSALWVSGCCG